MNAEISEIVKKHQSGKLAYHVALEQLVELGMIQIEAHELLFPEISEDDFQIDLPFDPSDIMQIKLIEKKGDEEE